jgi:hypothetical protein
MLSILSSVEDAIKTHDNNNPVYSYKNNNLPRYVAADRVMPPIAGRIEEEDMEGLCLVGKSHTSKSITCPKSNLS